MRPTDLAAMLAKTIPARLPVMISGAPGIGKTDVVHQAAKAAGADIIVCHPVVDDPTDYKGLPAIVEGHAMFLPYGQLQRMMDAGRLTVVFFDDLGQAPLAVQAAAMQLFLARTINGHKVSDHVVFIAATNRAKDRAGVSGILEPVKSRFNTIVELTVGLDDWTRWATDPANGIDPSIVAFLRFVPSLLHDFKPSADLTQSPCPRTWAKLSELLTAGVEDLEAWTGSVGEDGAAQYAGFRRIWQSLPAIDGILLNPKTALVPEEPSARYAITTALATRASTQTAPAIFQYAARLPEEFSILLIRDSARRCQGIEHTTDYIRWFSTHQDVLI